LHDSGKEQGEDGMTFDNRYSSTVPAPLDGMPAAAQSPELASEVRRAEFQAAGAAGVELTAVLVRMRQALDTLVKAQPGAAVLAGSVLRCLDDASRIAKQCRLLARLAGGEVRHNHEQVRLDQMLDSQLDARQQSCGPSGVVQRTIMPATVVVDRDLASALVEAALEAAMGPGQRVEISLHIKDWPAHALLRIGSSAPPHSVSEDPDHEQLSWYLVLEISRLLGVTVDRVRSPGQVLMVFEFPRTVRELDGLTAMEVEMDLPSAIGDSSRVLAGHRALIISSDVKLREEAKRVCRDMGMNVDNVPSSALAAQRCALDPPDILIVDERFNDERFQQLREQLSARHPQFPVVEIAYGGVASIAAWGSTSTTRVSRTELLSQLPQALALEMSRVL
jgi:hypothetical protein